MVTYQSRLITLAFMLE